MSLTQRTMLPGEPISPAQANAAAKVASIAGAYQVHRWTQQMFFDPQDWSELNADQLEFLNDYSLEREDCSHDAIEDALWRFVRYENLSAEVRSPWYPAGTIEPPEPTHWRVWLSVGGPSCYLQGEFCNTGIDEVEVVCSWAGPNQHYSPTDLEREALEWFASQLVA